MLLSKDRRYRHRPLLKKEALIRERNIFPRPRKTETGIFRNFGFKTETGKVRDRDRKNDVIIGFST